MASVKQRKATFISKKLKFLKDQGDELISAVGDYVNRIIVAGEAWTQGGDNNMKFQELCHIIESASVLLCEKCEELADLSSQSITAADSTPATSDRQPAAPLASTATTSYRQSTESVQPADGANTKQVLDRIAVIEEAMCSFRSRTEKVVEQQSGIDQQLKELLSKLSESHKKHSSKFKQVKQQIIDIRETRDATEQEQKTRLQSLEKQLQKISSKQNRQREEMECQAELVEKLVHVPNLLESLKENVDALDARIEESIDDSSNKYKNLETEMRDQSEKVMANTQIVQLISEGQAQNTTLLRELETRLQTLEADGGRNVKDVQKQAEKGKANFRILCQMLNDRLRPLEQLRTCLNERASMRDDNVTKLTQLIQEVAVMSPRLQQLEVKSPGTRCGFTAGKTFTGDLAVNTIISQYKLITFNVGENFNADRGIFTAPVDGLYVTAVSLYLTQNGNLGVGVKHKQSLDQKLTTFVCVSSAVTKQTTGCGVGVVDMKAGEVLYSHVYDVEKNDNVKWVYFSCFLLGSYRREILTMFQDANKEGHKFINSIMSRKLKYCDHVKPDSGLERTVRDSYFLGEEAGVYFYAGGHKILRTSGV